MEDMPDLMYALSVLISKKTNPGAFAVKCFQPFMTSLGFEKLHCAVYKNCIILKALFKKCCSEFRIYSLAFSDKGLPISVSCICIKNCYSPILYTQTDWIGGILF